MNIEQSLLNQGHTLLNLANTAITDSYKLHDKIDREIFVDHIYNFLQLYKMLIL